MTFEKQILANGRAVLYRGDCLDVLSDVGEVDVLLTDPPYELKNKFGQIDGSAWGGRGSRRLEFDWDVEGVTRDTVTPSLVAVASKVRCAAVVFCGSEQIGAHASVLRNAGMVAKSAVWAFNLCIGNRGLTPISHERKGTRP